MRPVRFSPERVLKDEDAAGVWWMFVDSQAIILPDEVRVTALQEKGPRNTLVEGHYAQESEWYPMAEPVNGLIADEIAARIIGIVRRLTGRDIPVNGEIVTEAI